MKSKTLLPAAALALLAGCAGNQPLPLLFGQSQTVGIALAVTAPEQGGELSIGYRDKNIAIVPTQQMSDGSGSTNVNKDALSVLGRFDVEAGGAQPLSASIGKFFATGIAAQSLASGFACEVSAGKACGQDGTPPVAADAPADDGE